MAPAYGGVHQYVERSTGRVRTERLFGDRMVNLIYNRDRESASLLYKALTTARVSRMLAFTAFDAPLASRIPGVKSFARTLGADLSECLEPPERLQTARRFFERKIRYEAVRPMPEASGTVVSPADAKMLAGSLAWDSPLFLKEKFFRYDELLGKEKPGWRERFAGGDFAVFRLTPEKYHYNHVPVSGRVADIYELDGAYNPCNPGAVMVLAAPYSRNRRVVTVIDTDVPAGDGVGVVAMVEVAALMVGDIVQCYSETGYDAPVPVRRGMFLEKGRPKSLFRPGSSTDVLLFEKNRIIFSEDLLANQRRTDVATRFSAGFGKPLVETEVSVRAPIAHPRPSETSGKGAVSS